jgi:hypothetical protein
MNRVVGTFAFLALALLAAACGGGSKTGSSTAGVTGASTATVSTSTTSAATRASANGSFDIRFGRLQRRLAAGLRQIESTKVGTVAIGAGTVLTGCTNAVTSQLGKRARTPRQQQAVSDLRTACGDVAQAVAKLKAGDKAAATRLARIALQQVRRAGSTSK